LGNQGVKRLNPKEVFLAKFLPIPVGFLKISTPQKALSLKKFPWILPYLSSNLSLLKE